MASSPTATAVHHFKTFYHTTTRQGHLPTFRLLDIPIEVRLLVYEAIARIELPTINTKGQLKHPHLDPCLHKIRHEIVSAVYHTVPLEFHNNLILERAGLSMLLAIFVPYSCFYALQTPFTKLFLGLAVFHAALACCFFLRELPEYLVSTTANDVDEGAECGWWWVGGGLRNVHEPEVAVDRQHG